MWLIILFFCVIMNSSVMNSAKLPAASKLITDSVMTVLLCGGNYIGSFFCFELSGEQEKSA